MSRKIYPDATAALEGLLHDGMTIMSGGFGLSGNPEHLIPAVRDSGVKELTVISNNCGADDKGLWVLLNSRPDPPRWSRPTSARTSCSPTSTCPESWSWS